MNNIVEIFETELREKTFVAYLKNGRINFGVKINDEISNDILDEEKKILQDLYMYIVGKKEDVLHLTPLNIDNTKVEMFFNTRNKFYSFYVEGPNGLEPPKEDLLIRLNRIYNNERETVKDLNDDNSKYSDNINKINKSKDIKRFIKYGSMVLTLTITSSLAVSSLPVIPDSQVLFNIDSKIDSMYKDYNEYEENDYYSFEDIEKVIDSNENLTNEEKKFIKKLKLEIEDNLRFVNIEQIKRNLGELKIVYNSESNIENGFITYGTYSYIGSNRNTIEMYASESYPTTQFEDCDKCILVHELNHLLTKRSFLETIPGAIGMFVQGIYNDLGVNDDQLSEMVNELFTREYLSSCTDQLLTGGYHTLMPVMYALCEIIDQDVLRKYKFNSDATYITQYLESIGVDKATIHSLYKDLEIQTDLTIKAQAEDATAFDKAACFDNNNDIYGLIKKIYETKYGKNMEDDLIMLSYFYQTPYSIDSMNKKLLEQLGTDKIENITPKGYICEDYIKRHGSLFITNDSNLGRITILDDDNRYVDEYSKSR